MILIIFHRELPYPFFKSLKAKNILVYDYSHRQHIAVTVALIQIKH